ncbi:hypothetical protein IWQ60_005546 [Tieghemiomyces parasiticus]|uniref:Ribosome biogenesis protein NOP53 n=1 Tax=Tieghemiomyces parasiticus TaxID=78921 RepID=A0A9W8ABK0_9FUNG|nr:hypothetical protein IWQ60_005546 [Tieghemiomyces parasiticus]
MSNTITATGSQPAAKPPRRSSRKGKQAWRKNIDMEPIENTLEQQRADERLGIDRMEIETDTAIFSLDTEGDAATKKQVKHAVKPLMVDRILMERSEVRAIRPVARCLHPTPAGLPWSRTGDPSKRAQKAVTRLARQLVETGQIQQVTERLRQSAAQPKAGGLSNRYCSRLTPTAGKQRLMVVNTPQKYDIWSDKAKAADEQKEKDNKKRSEIEPSSAAGVAIPTRAPPSIGKRLRLPAIVPIHPGASYKPRPEDADQLSEQIELRKARIAAASRIKHNTYEHANTLANDFADNTEDMVQEKFVFSDSEAVEEAGSDMEASAAEEEDDDEQMAEMREYRRKLIAKAVRKTFNQRQKEKLRRTQQHQLAHQARHDRLHDAIGQVDEVVSELAAANDSRKRRAADDGGSGKEFAKANDRQRPRLNRLTRQVDATALGNADPDEPLRRIKPQVNLFGDHFYNLQKRNMIEARGAKSKKNRRVRMTTYEKLSYRNFV